MTEEEAAHAKAVMDERRTARKAANGYPLAMKLRRKSIKLPMKIFLGDHSLASLVTLNIFLYFVSTNDMIHTSTTQQGETMNKNEHYRAIGRLVALAEKAAFGKKKELSVSQINKGIANPLQMMPFLIREFIQPVGWANNRLTEIMQDIDPRGFDAQLTLIQQGEAQYGYYSEKATKSGAERQSAFADERKSQGLFMAKDWLPNEDRDLFKSWCLDRRRLAGKLLPKDERPVIDLTITIETLMIALQEFSDSRTEQ